MAFITEKQFDTLLDVPILLPTSQLTADSWLVCSAIGVSEANPIEFTVRFLQLRIVRADSETRVTLGLYKDFNPNQTPLTQTPIELLTATGGTNNACTNVVGSPFFQERDASNPLTIGVAQGAGVYTWVIYSSTDTLVAVNGSARINLAPT